MDKNENFINKSILIHKDRYDYSLVNYINNKTKVKIICPVHGIFEQQPANHIHLKSGCPKCANKNMSIDDFIKRFNNIHDNYYDYSLVEYINMHTKIKIICPIHGVFEQTPHNHIRHGCKKCFFDKKRNDKEVIINKFKMVHNDLYNYDLVEYISMHTKVKIVCPVHGIFEQTPVNHLQGKGCYKCSPNSKKNYFDIIEKLNNLHDNKYEYDTENFDRTSNKIRVICNKHGEFFQTLNNHLDGHGCIFCNESSGEKKIVEYLRNKNINFIRQKKFDDCKDTKKLPFDFYLSDYNICIEYDGIQHFESVDRWGGEKQFDIIKKHDIIKNEFCEKNSLKLLRINYKDDVINKLNKYINDMNFK